MRHEELVNNFDFMNTKRYKPDVLIGNWFEERFNVLVDRHAILPAIAERTSYTHGPSEYRTSYRRPARRVTWQLYTTSRISSFANRLRSRLENHKLFDDIQFLDNFTTTSDVAYRILPEQARNHDCAHRTNELLRVYGNATNFGLRRCKRLQQRLELLRFRTSYKDVYTPKLQLLRRTRKSMIQKTEPNFRKKIYAKMCERQIALSKKL